MIKGVAPKFSDSDEEPVQVYLNVFFAYLMSKLFNVPYYLDHGYLDRIDENRLHRGLAEHWKKLFNTFLNESRRLDQSDISLMVDYRDLPKHFGSTKDVLAVIDFEDAYEIFLDNYDVYAAKVQIILSGRFKAHCLFEPENKIFDREKINITIDLNVTKSLLPTSVRGQQLQDSEQKSESQTDYLHKSEKLSDQTDKNQYIDTTGYLTLIKQIINSINNEDNKEIEIHIFSAGNSAFFKELLVEFSAIHKINLHLNVPIPEMFYFASISDYLICSRSKHSWFASLMNANPSFIKYPFEYVLAPTTHYFSDGLSLIKDQFVQNKLAKKIWTSHEV